MVAFYKHDIPAWMDGTEDLTDREYRVFHVICQLIYLNEGPIKVNERGIAGRCNTNVLAFRTALEGLLSKGRLTLDPNGTLDQARANLELTRIGTNRVHARLGGEARAKALKKLKEDEAVAQRYPALRLEETRLDKNQEITELPLGPVLVHSQPEPAHPSAKQKTPLEQAKTDLYARSKAMFNGSGGQIATKLLEAKAGDVYAALSALGAASEAGDPKTFIWGIIKKNRPAGGII